MARESRPYGGAVTLRPVTRSPVRSALGSAKQRAQRRLRDEYYSRGWRHDFPGKAAVARRLAAWEESTNRGDVPKDRESWNRQYERGGWDFLAGIEELAHYAVIVGYAHHVRPGGSVLDVGCGAGVLHQRFLAVGYDRYVGIDISDAAIARLAAEDHARAEFLVVPAEQFTPDDSFDVVIFNESVTYLDDPVEQFARYLGHLAPGGVAIVSCHVQSARAQAILDRLIEEHDVVDLCVVARGSTSWKVVLFRPGALQDSARRVAST